jgi:hypothetical protein
VEREISNGETVPDFWDECDASERLAGYLAMCGYQKVPPTEQGEESAV